MKISAAYFALAAKLQEAANAMSHDDIRNRLRDALNDQYRGTGNWAYVVAVFGDDSSGFCIYSCNDDLCKAAYTCDTTGATIDTANAVDVVPLTTYEEEPAEGLTEAGRRNSSRDLKQLQAIHDSAKNLGAVCAMKEAAPATTASLKLTESAATVETILLKESRADYEIKLIAPGKGSSAFYPAEVLKRDGPKVFGAGTHVYLNHPTAAEEAQRPEGDVSNLAGVLSTTAVYHEAHAKGPGLYARMKVFADHAQMVEEKAPHVGMSIRAAGVAEAGKVRDGVPVLKELTSAESVDVVTRAGAGGMILTEAARGATQEASMTEAEITKLVEAGVKAALAESGKATAALQSRALRGDAREEATRLMESITLPAASKARVIQDVIERSVPVKDGELDRDAFRSLVEAQAKSEGQYLTSLMGNSARPVGLGTSSGVVQIDAKEAAERKRAAAESAKEEEADAVAIFESLDMPKEAAIIAARGRVA